MHSRMGEFVASIHGVMTKAPPADRPSAAVQDYLKAVYSVAERSKQGLASTSQVSGELGVSQSSASAMLKRLSELGFAESGARGSVRLTEPGRLAALEVIRHHRLLETFLVDKLGMPWDRVHDEAEVLEHHISQDLAARIAEALGEPDRDPHGHPIPTADGEVADGPSGRLADLPEGTRAIVSVVSDQDPELLRFLADLRVVPGAAVQIVARAPFEGPLSLRVDDHTEVALPVGAARHVSVEAVAPTHSGAT